VTTAIAENKESLEAYREWVGSLHKHTLVDDQALELTAKIEVAESRLTG
jgi:hypothetical protein